VRYEDIADKSEAEIEALLFKRPELPASRPQPNWATVAADLRKPAVTLQLLWQEYRDQHPDGYSYSQFRRLYREHLNVTPEPRMRRTLTPAEMCEVDYAGMTMPVATADGERQVSVFVGTLPFSTIIYAEARRRMAPVLSSEEAMLKHRRGHRPPRTGSAVMCGCSMPGAVRSRSWCRTI
jgi:transposase